MAESAASARGTTLRIGEWTVDAAMLSLHRDDRTERLEPKVMDVLLLLARQPGTVVTRDDFEREVWGGRFVAYGALANAIAKLRRVLGDAGRDGEYIETVSKTGYRLVAEVHELSGAEAQPARAVSPERVSRRRVSSAFLALIMLAAAVAAFAWYLFSRSPAAGDVPGIAVLPFENLGDPAGEDYLANGITNDLITDLAKLRGLRVIARESAFAFRESSAGVREIAERLGVRYLVRGSVQRAADQLRINTALVDARADRVLWAERYERRIDALFALQDELVERVITALRLQLDPDERLHLARDYSRSLEAYDAFLQGQDHYARRSPEEHRLAEQAYRRAIELDPGFARAWAGLALMRSRGLIDGWDPDPPAALRESREFADRAETLAADLPQVQFVQGQLDLLERRYPDALARTGLAIDVNPGYADAHALRAWTLHFAGRPTQGLEAFEIASRLNPRIPVVYLLVRGALHYRLGNVESAIADFERGVAINPNYQQVRLWLAAAYVAAGRADDGRWQITELLALNPYISLGYLEANLPIEDAAYRDRLLNDLRTAGLE
ncbi:MAG: winged helix-turn-helix domain-containing protein [Chromatiales bacterium]|nr:winged helix-turn-helix domain-containing protein [Chromatiales bacterium]